MSVGAGRAALVAGAIALVAGCGRSTRPNVLLIVMDTARSDRLSCYGYARPTTPHVDGIAAEGLLYENCITPGSWTLPAHASLFSGLYPRDHHTDSGNQTLAESFTTLAEELGAAGYQTVGFSNNVWLSKSSGLQQGFAEFHEVWRDHLGPQFPDDGAGMTTERVLRWIDARPDPHRPFFLFINYFEPHLPYRPPPPYDRRFLPASADPQEVAMLQSWQHPREVGYILKVPGMAVSPEQFALLEAEYDGEIAYLDSRLGELVAGLRARGLYDSTVVAVTSDHGEHFGDHGLMDHKMSVYDALLRVPLVLRYPPALPHGRRIQAHVQTNDLYPTILRLAGIDRAAPAGSRLLPLEDGESAGREYTFAEFDRPTTFLAVMDKRFPGVDYRAFDRALKAVRGHRYKYIWTSDDRPELYDLGADPGEEHNLVASRPEVLAGLRDVLAAYERGSDPQTR